MEETTAVSAVTAVFHAFQGLLVSAASQKKRLIHEAFVTWERGNNYCYASLVNNLQALPEFGYCPEVLRPGSNAWQGGKPG